MIITDNFDYLLMKIDITSLRKTFGEKVAVDIDEYHIGHGEMIGLVGNNGAGKTTLFRLMLDLLKADQGTVEFGIPVSSENENTSSSETEQKVNPAESEVWKDHTGAYVDDSFLIDFLTPEEYFDFIGKVCGMDKGEVDTHVKEFEHLMAGEIMDQKKLIRDFSAGNKQKIGIIAALLNRPSLVILDEPFNFLDPSSQNILKHVLTEYNRNTGATIIISSHNLSHTIDICPRITLLEHGHIVKDLSNIDHSAADELNQYFDQQAERVDN